MFAYFPNYATEEAIMPPERVNMLADFTGWVVKQNEGLFREVIEQGRLL